MPRWTIADVIAAGDTIYANCSDPRCFASTKLDLQMRSPLALVPTTVPCTTISRRCSSARNAGPRADRIADRS